MAFSVVLDACVLVPHPLFDTLLRLAHAGLYRPLWSAQILEEVRRTLVDKFGIDEGKAERRVDRMLAAFPDAMITGHERLVSGMTNDPKDRHVLAAAVRAGASMIVTANLKDFPPDSTGPYAVEVSHPDEFLLDQLDLDPSTVVRCLREQQGTYRNPAWTPVEFYGALGRTVPVFASQALELDVKAARSLLPPGRPPVDDQMPLPLAVRSDEETLEAFFPEGEPDLGSPLGVAFMWWAALGDTDEYANALNNLTYCPEAWHGFKEARQEFAGRSLAQKVHPYDEAPEHAVFVKFVPGLQENVQAFGPAQFTDVLFLVLVLDGGGAWKVWGFSRHRPPAYAEIVGQQS